MTDKRQKAAPILYAAWAEAGHEKFPVSELGKLRTFGSDLEGHPTPVSNLFSFAHVMWSYSQRMADVSPLSSRLRDVSRGGTSATQRQKFHTDDTKSVRNPVRRTNWSME